LATFVPKQILILSYDTASTEEAQWGRENVELPTIAGEVQNYTFLLPHWSSTISTFTEFSRLYYLLIF